MQAIGVNIVTVPTCQSFHVTPDFVKPVYFSNEGF